MGDLQIALSLQTCCARQEQCCPTWYFNKSYSTELYREPLNHRATPYANKI